MEAPRIAISGFLAKLKSLVFPGAGAGGPLDRGRDRYRRAAWSALASVAAKSVDIATGLITVPLTLSYLGGERYGLWMALTGLVTFLTFTDMGLGIGLQNALSRYHGLDDQKSPRSSVSSALCAILILASVLALVAAVVLPRVPLGWLIKAEDPQAQLELLPTALAMALTFALGLPLGLIQRIYNAYQRGYWAAVWASLGRILGLAGVLLCIHLGLGLPWLAVCLTGLPLLGMAIGGLRIFRRYPWLRPSLKAVNWESLRPIVGTGGSAVIAQIAAVAMISGPPVLIAHCLGAGAVTPFAVAQKLLAVSSLLLGTMVLPLWPAYGEAAARGDWEWVRRTFRRTLIVGFCMQIPIFAALAFAGQDVIRLWAGPAAVPAWPLLMAINVWFLLSVLNTCCAVALNGLDHLIGQAIYGPLFAVAACALAYFALPRYGLAPAIWSIVLFGIVPNGICASVELAWVTTGRRTHGSLRTMILRRLRAGR